MLAVALASDSLLSAWSVQPADQPTISVSLSAKNICWEDVSLGKGSSHLLGGRFCAMVNSPKGICNGSQKETNENYHAVCPEYVTWMTKDPILLHKCIIKHDPAMYNKEQRWWNMSGRNHSELRGEVHSIAVWLRLTLITM